MIEYLQAAADLASRSQKELARKNFLLASVGVRQDGAIVQSKNGASIFDNVETFRPIPLAHTEGRILRKLGKYASILAIARVKRNGVFSIARPCSMCQNIIRAFCVERVIYSIDEMFYGVWFPMRGVERTCRF